MKKSRVIFTVIVMMLIISCFVLGKVFSDLKKENEIKKEIKTIVQVFGTENTDDDDVNAILERRIYSKGNYGEVEDAIKNYYKDLYSYLKNITFLMDEDNFINYLTPKNISEDGPTFSKSINNLQTTKAQLNDKYTEFDNQLNKETKQISYVFSRDIDSYYKNLYLEFISNYTPSNLTIDMKEKYDKTLKLIDLYNEAFAFLTANAAHWQINDDVLTFDDTVLYEGYKKITDNIESLKIEKQTS